jgi:SnoaL-like domain
MTDRLPGTATEIILSLFSRGEAMDSEGFVSFFSESPVYQFGNFPTCLDKPAIKVSIDAFFAQVNALYHQIKMIWEVGDVIFVEMDVIYWRKDESVVSLPCCDIFRLDGDLIAELRIFMDVTPLADATIPISSDTSVFTIREGHRSHPPELMKTFFTENPEGAKRVKEGFVPKWSLNERIVVPLG